MTAPATLDGGDVLRLGRKLYVGRSGRTNEEGIAQLARAFAPAGLEVARVGVGERLLHLKCACSPLSDGRVLLAEGTFAAATFAPATSVVVPAKESYAANAVACGGRVLIAAGHPQTKRLLANAGFEVRELDMSEFRKADGSLTCLSLRLGGL